MVMLRPGAVFDAAAVVQQFAQAWPDAPPVTDIETKELASTAAIPGGTVGFVHIPMPIPEGDLQGPIALAWHWPDAAASVAAHTSHVIVFASSTTLDRLDLRLLHTRILAAILASADAVGVYVGGALLIRSADDFRNDTLAATREQPPIPSWIGLNAVREETSLSAYTTGLSDFGIPEVEIRRSALPASDLFGIMADVASYQLSSQRILNDGDTFGRTASDRTRVRYSPSEFLPDTTVAVLELN